MERAVSLKEGRSSNSKIAFKSRVHIARYVVGEYKIARKLHFSFIMVMLFAARHNLLSFLVREETVVFEKKDAERKEANVVQIARIKRPAVRTAVN